MATVTPGVVERYRIREERPVPRTASIRYFESKNGYFTNYQGKERVHSIMATVMANRDSVEEAKPAPLATP